MDAARREALRIAVELRQTSLDHPDLVGLVVDREVGAVAEPSRLRSQDSPARSVERENPDRSNRPAEHLLQPLAHLSRCLVRERDGENLVWPDTAHADEVCDSMRENASLPGARA